MINGAFGVGKTTVSNELLKVIKNSMIFDPEEVGFMLNQIIPQPLRSIEAVNGDFQDLSLWKELTVQTAKLLITHYKMNLIVPMTIRKKEYFHYIFDGFQRIDEKTFHFCLVANEETIYERLRKRGEEEGNWCFQQTRLCLESFNENDFNEYIQTEQIDVETIVRTIKEKISS